MIKIKSIEDLNKCLSNCECFEEIYKTSWYKNTCNLISSGIEFEYDEEDCMIVECD